MTREARENVEGILDTVFFLDGLLDKVLDKFGEEQMQKEFLEDVKAIKNDMKSVEEKVVDVCKKFGVL